MILSSAAGQGTAWCARCPCAQLSSHPSFPPIQSISPPIGCASAAHCPCPSIGSRQVHVFGLLRARPLLPSNAPCPCLRHHQTTDAYIAAGVPARLVPTRQPAAWSPACPMHAYPIPHDCPFHRRLAALCPSPASPAPPHTNTLPTHSSAMLPAPLGYPGPPPCDAGVRGRQRRLLASLLACFARLGRPPMVAGRGLCCPHPLAATRQLPLSVSPPSHLHQMMNDVDPMSPLGYLAAPVCPPSCLCGFLLIYAPSPCPPHPTPFPLGTLSFSPPCSGPQEWISNT